MADSKEAQFQQDIIDAMTADGWRTGPASGYDALSAVYTEDLVDYLREAWPERWEKFAAKNPQDPQRALVRAVTRELERGGTLDVLRHCIKTPGVKLELCSFKPDHGMNPESLACYHANRLRVVPEVSYSPHARSGEYNPRLDLVLFVNGIPTATLELKSEFKQSVENAKRQYRRDRPVKDPITRKPEPLLTFKRGALVHFAGRRLRPECGLRPAAQPGRPAAGIYHWAEVEHFARAFFDPKANAAQLSYYCLPAKERYTTRYKVVLEQIQTWAAAHVEAERNHDKTGLHRAAQELKDAHTSRDELDLFRKNLQSFVRSYEFLSQIVDFEDRELEQLCVHARALYPLLRVENLEGQEIDVAELELTHYRLNKRAEHQLNLGEEDGDYAGLKPLSDVGSGKPHDPEKKRLSEIIEQLNDIFGAEVSDKDKLHFAHGVADRIRRDEAVMAQVQNHSPDPGDAWAVSQARDRHRA